MSQFPFPGQQPQQWAAPQQPQYAPAPQYAPQPQYAPPPQFAPPMPQGFAPMNPYGTPYGAPVQQHVAPGDIAAFMNQPKTGRPKSISWAGVPDGSTLAGVVTDDVSDRDVVPDTDPKTQQVKTWRDGSPKYALVVTIGVAPSALYPEGKATLYCRGDLWDKLSAAMAAAGRTGAPKAGDMLSVTLVERRAAQGQMSPKNIFSVAYATREGDGGNVIAAPALQAPPAPVYEQPQQPVAAPQMPVPPAQQYAQQTAPAASFPAMPAQQVMLPQQPMLAQPPMAAPAPGVPAGLPQMTPEQAALLAKIKGGQS